MNLESEKHEMQTWEIAMMMMMEIEMCGEEKEE